MEKLPLMNQFRRRETLLVRTKQPHKLETLVCSYQPDEHGLSKLVPVPESQVPRAIFDGKSLEIANLMYAQLPEDLCQIVMQDAMGVAETITTHSVRRFGKLQEQRAKIEEMFNPKTEE